MIRIWKNTPEESSLRICLAVLLGLPLEDVPDFENIWPGTSDVYVHMQNWLNSIGKFGVFLYEGAEMKDLVPYGSCIVGGSNEKGKQYAVFNDGKLWHNPDRKKITEKDWVLVIAPLLWDDKMAAYKNPEGEFSYDNIPCTCLTDCAPDCKGECGCEACRTAYADFMSGE